MSNKILCPGCDSYSSTIWDAVRSGGPCPVCGLSASAIAEIEAVQARKADEDLKEQLSAAIIERDKAQTEARLLRTHLERIKRAVKAEPTEDGGPW